MWNMLWPLLMIVGFNCLYHICTKSMPEDANAFGAVTVTYVVGALIAGVIFLAGAKPSGVLPELRKLNWAPFALGAAIVGLEAGHVFLYRMGWKVSIGSLACNICLAIALLFVGYFLFRDQITVRQLIGVAVCAVGLLLITR